MSAVSLAPYTELPKSHPETVIEFEGQPIISNLATQLFPEISQKLIARQSAITQKITNITKEISELRKGWTHSIYKNEGTIQGMGFLGTFGGSATIMSKLGTLKPESYLNTITPNEMLCVAIATGISLFVLGILISCYLPEMLTLGKNKVLPQKLEDKNVELTKLKQKKEVIDNLIEKVDEVALTSKRIQKFSESWIAFEKEPHADQIPKLLKGIAKISIINVRQLLPNQSKIIPLNFDHLSFWLMENACITLKTGSIVENWNALKKPLPKDQSYPKITAFKDFSVDMPDPHFFHVYYNNLTAYLNDPLADRLSTYFEKKSQKIIENISGNSVFNDV